MTPDSIFRICTAVAGIGWLALLLRPRRAAPFVAGALLPLLLGVLYAVLVAGTLGRTDGGFTSLEGVAQLFRNPWALLAGWVHYLAFDLFVGAWIARDAARQEFPHLLIAPLLLLTFLLGPLGLLLYLALRLARTRSLRLAE